MRYIFKIRFFFLFALIFVLTQCDIHKPASKTTKPTVLVSTSPYNYFVKKIAGNLLHVRTLIPANVNAHHYEPTPKEVEGVKKASIWFQVGEPIEEKIQKSIQTSKILLRINLFDILATQNPSISDDVHIWMNPYLVKMQCRIITRVLSQRFPEHKQIFEKNRDKFYWELDVLDSEIRQRIDNSDTNYILVSHPAFTYFCQRYDLEQISLEQAGKDPLPNDLDRIFAIAQAEDIRLIIALEQVSLKGVKFISERLQIPYKMFNPYDYDYEKNMLYLAKLVVESSKK